MCLTGAAPQEQSQGARSTRGPPEGLRTADSACRPDCLPNAEQIQRPLLASAYVCPNPRSPLARNPGRIKALLLPEAQTKKMILSSGSPNQGRAESGSLQGRATVPGSSAAQRPGAKQTQDPSLPKIHNVAAGRFSTSLYLCFLIC